MTQTITIGDVTLTRVVEWAGEVAPVDVIFPDAEPSAWQKHRSLVAPDFWNPEANTFRSHLQSWVIRSQGRVVIVDTGAGNGRPRPNLPAFDHLDTKFPMALRAAGVDPETVDVVVNTHLHGDHVGWNTVLTDGEYVPMFPNATYLMPSAEVDFWRPDSPHTSVSAEQMLNVYEDSVDPVLRYGRVQQWEGSHRIDDALRLDVSPGHTPGMSVLTIESAGEAAVLAADAFLSPLQVVEDHLNSCFDEDADAARSSRGRLLRWAADRKALVVPSHLGGHSAFRVAERAGAFVVGGWADFDRPNDEGRGRE